jgi:hypothetical protein
MPVFTPEEVQSLNDFQKSGYMHPFTCGSGNRCDEKHLDGEGLLVATENGWECPWCDWRQNWAHDFMKNRAWEPAALQQKALLGKWREG